MVEGANHADALVAYLGAIEAGCPVLLTGPAAAPGLAAAYDPDVSWSRDGGLHEHRAEPAVDLHPDLAVLLSTSGTTGSPKLVRLSAANVLAQRRRHRRLPGPHDGRCRADGAAHALLLRAVRRAQPSARGRGPAADRGLGRRRVVLGRGERAPDHLTRRCALHVRAARSGRLRRHGAAAPAVSHPGRGSARARGRASLCTPRARAGLGPLRDVRPDRGDRPDGLPAAAARRDRTHHHRHPGRGRLVHDRAAAGASVRRAGRPRGRRARLPRAQRDAGLRGVAGRAGARTHRHRAAHRRHRTPARGRALRSRRAAQPRRQGLRAAPRPRPRREGARGPACRGRGG